MDAYRQALESALQSEVDKHLQSLAIGTPTRDEDQILRGVLRGLRKAQGVVAEVHKELKADDDDFQPSIFSAISSRGGVA